MTDARLARVVVGLVLAFALALLLGHPRVREVERRLGLNILTASGIPFLVLGAIFSLDSVDILSDRVLADLRPAFDFGLGWIGFIIGLQFDLRRLDELPRTLGGAVIAQSLVPMVLTGAVCGLTLMALDAVHSTHFLARDVMVLMACAAASAPVDRESFSRIHGVSAGMLASEIANLDDVVALALLGVVAVWFRPDSTAVAWLLPPGGWLMVFLGLGAMLGALTYLIVRGATTAEEELALLLGTVALSAGLASYLALSVPVVCAISGALLANLPIRDKAGFRQLLLDVERPLYLIFLVVVGASWQPGAWQGWLLAVSYVLARFIGKKWGASLASWVGPDELPAPSALARALAHQSQVAIVVIVGATTLYEGEHLEPVHWAINAIIVGGVLTEILMRVLHRAPPSSALGPSSENARSVP